MEFPEAEGGRRSLKPLRLLPHYVLAYPGLVAGALFSLALAAVTTLTLPLAIRRLIDQGFSAADAGSVATFFWLLLAVSAVLALASAGRYYFVITLGERVVADLRRDLFAHITTLSPAFFDRSQSGEIVSRLSADASQLKSAVGATASIALRNVVLGSGAVTMMVVTSPKLAGLVLGAIPLIVLPLAAFGRSVRRRSRLAQDTLAEANAFASEQIGAVRTLQAFTGEEAAVSRFNRGIVSAFEAARGSVLARSGLTFVAIFSISGSVLGVLWFGSRDVLSGGLSPGTLGQFMLYSVFAAGALGALSEVWGELSQAAGAAERIAELMTERPEIAAPEDPLPFAASSRGLVEFEDVSFAYPARPGQRSLHGVSFAVESGETVAVVGPSGAGKSTLFSLILRYYDAQAGRVMIDGVDVSRADPRALRRRIAVVPQDVAMFAASVRDNIAFGRLEASAAEIEAAARAAHADDFIARLPQGYDTQVGERGVTLSGGQRQRIAIARAILRDAPILLLDEATSALDSESETLVQAALERLMRGRTTIVIAHRLATVLKADRILVMDQGRLVEQGTHRSLAGAAGVYARLARLQFESGAEAFRGAAE